MTTVTANTNVRSGASLRNNVVMTLTQGTEVIVDGLSADGDWARVAVDEIAGWIFADLLADDVSDLAVVGGLNNAPMQAFQMRTGFGMPDCVDAPDAVLVQGTENYEIEFVVNDAEVRIGSTALLQTISETRMQIMMLDGVGIVDDLRIPAGWKAQIDLAPDDDNVTALPQAIGTWFDCMRLDDTDLALIDSLSDVPESVLNYPITVPAYSNQPCQSPSLPVETTTNTNTSNASNASQSEIAGVDCSTFQFLGPTSNISPRPQTFTWSEASGADEYELVFFSVIDQVFAGTFRTSNTNLTVTLGEVPTGSEIQIEVRAYINGQYACVTGRTDVITLVASGSGGSSGAASGASGSFSASWECNVISATSSDVTFKWFNPPAGTTGIEMDFDITAGGNDGGVSNVGDGSRTFGPHSTVIGADDFTNGYAETIPGGDTINLPPLNCN
ncbi:MAG: SH3 domain-containing protein [Chloroflexota bacterium]